MEHAVIQAPAQQSIPQTIAQLAPPVVNVGAPAMDWHMPLPAHAMADQPPPITNVMPALSLRGITLDAPRQVARPFVTPPAFAPSALSIQPPVPAAQPEVLEPDFVLPVIEPVRAVPAPAPTRDFLSPRQSDLLASTRNADISGHSSGRGADGARVIQRLLETAIAEIRSLAERPIDVSVTTRLDGRQIAQSVYKDLRERKVRNYETL
jgi:hypothetical protein